MLETWVLVILSVRKYPILTLSTCLAIYIDWLTVGKIYI